MAFFYSLKSWFGGGRGEDKSGYRIRVRCHRCGETIETRLDLQRDLSPRDEGGYVVRKTLVGSGTCFQRVEVTLTFDDRRQLGEREIVGGEFID